MSKANRALFVVEPEDGLSVRVSVEMMAPLFQTSAQFLIVIDLAVVNDPFRLVGIMYWLLPAGEVNDREPSHRQTYAVLDIETVLIGPSVLDRAVHAPEDLAIHQAVSVTDYSYDSAHNDLTILRPGLYPLLELSLFDEPLHFSVVAALFQQFPSDRYKDKKKNLYLGSLSVGCTDIALKDGIRQCQHQAEKEDGECTPKAVLNCVGNS